MVEYTKSRLNLDKSQVTDHVLFISVMSTHSIFKTLPIFLENGSHVFLATKQQAALVLNASRRFRYTMDFNKDEDNEEKRRMIRAHAQVIRVISLSSAYVVME